MTLLFRLYDSSAVWFLSAVVGNSLRAGDVCCCVSVAPEFLVPNLPSGSVKSELASTHTSMPCKVSIECVHHIFLIVHPISQANSSTVVH